MSQSPRTFAENGKDQPTALFMNSSAIYQSVYLDVSKLDNERQGSQGSFKNQEAVRPIDLLKQKWRDMPEPLLESILPFE